VDDFDRYPLHYAALVGESAAVRDLLRAGQNIDEFDDFGKTPLHYAATEGHLLVVQQLLEAGADVNAADVRTIGNTPLGDVAGECSFELATILIDAGADPGVPGWMKITPLYRASKRSDEEGRRVHALLLEHMPHRRVIPPS
jgi:ankyrin repeat protein